MINEIRSTNIAALRSTPSTAAAKPAAVKEEAVALTQTNDAVDIRPQTKLDKVLAATADKAAAIEQEMAPHVPGEVIVKTNGSTKGMMSFAESYGCKVIEKFNTPNQTMDGPSGEMLHLKLPEGMTTAQAMAAMQEDPSVAYVCPNHTYEMEEPAFRGETMSAADLQQAQAAPGQKKPNDLDSKLWGLNNEGQDNGTAGCDINAPEAWNITTGSPNGNGPLIAIIDTGVDITHPDLKANIYTNTGEIPGNGIDDDGNGYVDDYHGFNSAKQNGDVMDTNGHGSHVTGTIAAEGNNGQGVTGINWTANILPVKIFNDQGSTDAASIIRGINYATDMGARLTSNSWGGGGANEAIKEAFENSSALHMMSAGNSGTNNDIHGHFPSDYDLPNNLAVAATDRNDNLANFSCYGEKNVDIAAPGKDILSTVPGGGYAVYSGTSMATPHATGAAALLLAHDPTMSNDELKSRLMDGADKIASLDGKVASGGRLNIHKALTMEYNPAETNKA